MKKLLSLLSVLTISGNAIPTTIAISPYQKEEVIKNSDINYSKKNNFKKVNIGKKLYLEEKIIINTKVFFIRYI